MTQEIYTVMAYYPDEVNEETRKTVEKEVAMVLDSYSTFHEIDITVVIATYENQNYIEATINLNNEFDMDEEPVPQTSDYPGDTGYSYDFIYSDDLESHFLCYLRDIAKNHGWDCELIDADCTSWEKAIEDYGDYEDY